MAVVNSVPFSISVVGETTGETFRGDFEAVKFLSHRQQLVLDQERRRLVGNNAEDATDIARSLAQLFANCNVRLTKTPSWWSEAGNGIDLVDDNVALEVYTQAMKVQEDASKEITEKAKKAREDLKKVD